jgi:hypothetical protein
MPVSPNSAAPSLRPVRPYAVGPLVRLGRDGDGGYLVPQAALTASALLLSAGLHDDWSFEKDFKRHRPGARVVAVDGTAGLPLLLWRSFPRIFQILGAVLTLNFPRARAKWAYFQKVPDFVRFFRHELFLRKMLLAAPGHGGVTVPELLRAHAPAAGVGPDVLLKLDIEGAEFAVLRGELGPLLAQAAGLVIEFHRLDENWPAFLEIVARLEPGFVVAHVHGNNYEPLIPGTDVPRSIEVTWLNRRLAPPEAAPSAQPYPLAGLDQPCNLRAPDYVLRFD